MCHYIESICIEKGQIQNLSFHNKRFNTTRKELFGSSTFINLENYINAETHFERTKCRVIYDQEIIDVSYQPYKLPSINNLSLVFDNEINYKYKGELSFDVSTKSSLRLVNSYSIVKESNIDSIPNNKIEEGKEFWNYSLREESLVLTEVNKRKSD